METFVIACKGSELQKRLMDVWHTQELANIYYMEMKFNKQYEKTMQSAIMAKYALKQVLG